jgi:hypothetical protein
MIDERDTEFTALFSIHSYPEDWLSSLETEVNTAAIGLSAFALC